MRKLSYGSFEEVLRAHITPKITKLRLAEILLTSPVVDARKKDRTIQRKSCNIDSSIVTRVCSGERGLPPSLREYHAKPDALDYIKLCFSVDIVPRIQDSTKDALLKDILYLIEQDVALSAERKTYFSRCAAKEELGDFLAEVYLCAVSQRTAVRRTINLPGQNRFFYGREELMADIAAQFQSGVHVQGLYGMGGVGKTQIALQYAYAHLSEYEGIWWINAENRFTLQNSAAAFLTAQKLRPKDTDADSVRQAFLDYFNDHSGWLLIYDNAEYGTSDEYTALKDFFPASSENGHILLTTRCRNAFENAVQNEIPVFDANAAAVFLQRRSGCGDSPCAVKLAEQLGFLPLALEYAAAYIRETPGVDYAAYSKKLEQYSVKVLDRKVGHLTYKMTVREAFHVTLDKLLEDASINPSSRSVAQFLNICAYLAPDNIALDVFSAYGNQLPEPVRSVLKNELDRDALIRDLTRYSLVQVEWNTMSMHRLLQEVLRDETSPDNEILCINYAYGVFYSVFYSLHTAPLDTLREVLTSSVPHVQTILSRYVQRYKQGGQVIPDGVMAAKEYFSWTALLLADTKHLEGTELLEACRRDIPILQSAVDFYSLMGCGKTIYLAYTLMLLAQSNAQLGNTLTASEQYACALTVSSEVVEGLPTGQLDGLQSLYRAEVFQLASDICAAIASSDIPHFYPDLLWQNYRNLVAVAQKQMACCTSRDDANSYVETWLTLRVFSGQIANFTRRAFVLRMNAPAWLLGNLDSCPSDSIFGFFLPTEAEADAPAEIGSGFAVLLNTPDNIAAGLNGSWNTLAFPENVRTGEDMLKELLAIDADRLNTFGKRSLYGLICALAKHLKHEEIAAQHNDRMRELPC